MSAAPVGTTSQAGPLCIPFGEFIVVVTWWLFQESISWRPARPLISTLQWKAATERNAARPLQQLTPQHQPKGPAKLAFIHIQL